MQFTTSTFIAFVTTHACGLLGASVRSAEGAESFEVPGQQAIGMHHTTKHQNNRRLVLDGEDAPPDRFPYMVQVTATPRVFDPPDLQGYPLLHRCGGTLISPRVVLLAASCYYNTIFNLFRPGGTVPLLEKVVVGNYFRNDVVPGGQELAILGRYIHPQYTGDPREGNDVALFEIEPVDDPKTVALDCDDYYHYYYDKYKYKSLLGWGNFEQISPGDFVNQFAINLKIGDGFKPFDCKLDAKYKKAEETIFCTHEAGCFGDGGGPMLYVNHTWDNDVQTGILSIPADICSGDLFGGAFGTDTTTSFTRIASKSVIHWIYEIMHDLKEDFRCGKKYYYTESSDYDDDHYYDSRDDDHHHYSEKH